MDLTIYYLADYNKMEKVYSIAAKYGTVGIFLLCFTVFVSFDFGADNVESIIDLNEGKIKILGIIMAAIVSTFMFLVSGFQVQLKDKSNIISVQNKQIIDNGLLFVSELKKVTVALNENSRRDNETIKLVNDLASSVTTLHRKIESSDRMLKKHDDFIQNMKKISG